jgi:hypothetical protein
MALILKCGLLKVSRMASVLVVIWVTESGQKQVIGIQSGDKESATN